MGFLLDIVNGNNRLFLHFLYQEWGVELNLGGENKCWRIALLGDA